jgi:2-methylisocitrate lyase-like PEP mutase family enzyme
MEFSLVRYANAALGAWLKAMNDVLGALKREGSLNSVRDRLASFEDRQRVVQKEKYDRFETLNTNGSTAADK